MIKLTLEDRYENPDLAVFRRLLNYDPETGYFYWKVSRGGRKAGTRAGSKNANGYLKIRIKGTDYRAHRLAWLFVTGDWPDHDIDHVNGNRLDNRFENLRDVTHAVNHRNRKMNPANSSGWPNVFWDKQRAKWRVVFQFKVYRKYITVGYFHTYPAAVLAREMWMRHIGVPQFGFTDDHGHAREFNAS